MLTRSETRGPQPSTNFANNLCLSHAGDASSMAGVLKFELMVSPEASAKCELRASTGDKSARFDVESGQTYSLGLHFVMLTNGIHRIQLELEETNGSVSRVVVDVPVEHRPGLAATTAQLLTAHGTPLFFIGECDSSMYPYSEHVAWFDSPHALDRIEEMLVGNRITETEAQHLRDFVRDGFVVLPDLIDDALVDQVNDEIDAAVGERMQGYEFGSSQRIEHLHSRYPKVRELWLDSRHRRYANLIFGTTARPCQTLTYVRQPAGAASRHDPPHPVPGRLHVRNMDRATGRGAEQR